MPDSDLLPRGVYRAPCLSPDGETIHYAVDHNHRLLKNGWTYVAIGDNPNPVHEALWERLTTEDPEPPRSLQAAV